MDIEEAKRDLKYSTYSCLPFGSVMANKEAIETVLNELDKKEAVINEMAKEIYEDDNIFGFGIFKDINTPEKIKEYFTNKAENVGE